MKKIIICLSIIMLFYLQKNSNQIYIPKESIRFRVIANSNKYEDQKLKWDITSELLDTFIDISNKSDNINETRKLLNEKYNNINSIVNKYTDDYNINYGYNYFPKKNFENITYPEGKYESLVITLGNGDGDNWWCVIFPPLCIVEASYEDNKNIEYTTYVSEIIKKYK